MTECCPCDAFVHPPKLEIPAGLSRLPRQVAGLPEYRLAMLRALSNRTPLADWRAREGDDLGIMLLEMWAYVLDILGFYDERIAEETYLRTAVLRPSVRKLVELIGYQPRPALAASVVLAAIAEGHKPVTLPARTGVRSDAFGSEPPQVFETELVHTIHALKNQWSLGPVRDRFPDNDLLLDPRTAALKEGDLVVTRWTGAASSGSSVELRAGRVTSVTAIEALDGHSYKNVGIDSSKAMLDASVELGSVELLSPTKTAFPSRRHDAIGQSLIKRGISLSISVTVLPAWQIRVTLDTVYPELDKDDCLVVQRGRGLHAARIVTVTRSEIPMDTAVAQVTVPVTEIVLSPPFPAAWNASPERLVIHFGVRDAGTLTNPAKTHIGVTDFAAPGIAIDEIVEPLTHDTKPPGELLLLDAQDNGERVNGVVNIDSEGRGSVKLAADTRPFSPALRTPVRVFGNLVHVTRGETVFNEVLGSGDASQAFQTFTLANKPLTYFNDPSAPNGRRNTLEVRVNGIRSDEVSSFFHAAPGDLVYICRQDDEQNTRVIFGDGTRGARLPSGIDNVTATYRFGAGAAKPPPGAIAQLARPVEGLRRVTSPVAAGGGADADEPSDMRSYAPATALTLGRAVSLADFEALAREFGGVINAESVWAWDESWQRAVVKIWFISDGGDIRDSLRAFLIAQAAPGVPLVATEVQPLPTVLTIDMVLDERLETVKTKQAVEHRLIDDDTGCLAAGNIPISHPLFRSRIFDAVLGVDGVRAIRATTLDGKTFPFAVSTPVGYYRDFRVSL